MKGEEKLRIQISENKEFQNFIARAEEIIADLSPLAAQGDINGIENIRKNFKMKTEDFYRENRKLNIGVVGQVKAGKSSFLNTLLFEGKEILPKASTPKTATLTKMEYSEKNIIEIEYYSAEDWETLEDNACIDLDDEIYTSARELVELAKRNGLDTASYLEKGRESIQFDTYEELIAHLNDYVGEDGRFTPLVKAVTLYLNKEEFKGISIVDTPGLNDPIVSRTIRTKEFIEVCDVVFFLSQAGSFLDSSDWNLLSTQLPQKGVKRLVLIASKYDSGIRDILKVQDDDDIFGDDENTADNIPKACKIIKKKLRKRAKMKTDEFIKDLKNRCMDALAEVIRQCEEPYMVSAIAYNMSGKRVEEFTPEERNVYDALKQFSDDIESDMKLLGNFDEIKSLFTEVIKEKEEILTEKSRTFVPTAMEELKNLLLTYKEKTEKRIKILEENDKEQLDEQRKIMESQINSIKADVTALFGELIGKLETEKSKAVQEIKKESKDFVSIKERTGTITRTGTYTTGHLWWKKTEVYNYPETYTYCVAADAIDNLNRFAMEASSIVEEVFMSVLQLRDIKRKILNVVVENFDLGNEKYDSSLMRIMAEETVNAIEFPDIRIDISGEVKGITSKFNGKITSADGKNNLTACLLDAIHKMYDELVNKMAETVKEYKSMLERISGEVQEKLLSNITAEFDMLLKQCESKETEIAAYKEYILLIEKNLKGLI